MPEADSVSAGLVESCGCVGLVVQRRCVRWVVLMVSWRLIVDRVVRVICGVDGCIMLGCMFLDN